MEATWVRRELPVLEAIIADLDMSSATSMWPDGGDIASRTGLTLTEVGAALQALDGHYIALVRNGGPGDWHVTSVTPEARRAVGQWPSAESLVEEIATQISMAAEREPDGDRKRRLLTVARELAGAAKQIAVNVASAYLERGMPRA